MSRFARQVRRAGRVRTIDTLEQRVDFLLARLQEHEKALNVILGIMVEKGLLQKKTESGIVLPGGKELVK